MGLESRGRFFVGPGDEVYEGMVVGRADNEHDVTINVVRAKKLTNMRAAGTDENVKLPTAGGNDARARDRVHRRRRTGRGDAQSDTSAQAFAQRDGSDSAS